MYVKKKTKKKLKFVIVLDVIYSRRFLRGGGFKGHNSIPEILFFLTKQKEEQRERK